jgi:hypothetical protein
MLQALTSQDGEALGQNILDFSENQTCPVSICQMCLFCSQQILTLSMSAVIASELAIGPHSAAA